MRELIDLYGEDKYSSLCSKLKAKLPGFAVNYIEAATKSKEVDCFYFTQAVRDTKIGFRHLKFKQKIRYFYYTFVGKKVKK